MYDRDLPGGPFDQQTTNDHLRPATCNSTTMHYSLVLGNNTSVCGTVPLCSFLGEDYRVPAVGHLYPNSENSGFESSLYALNSIPNELTLFGTLF